MRATNKPKSAARKVRERSATRLNAPRSVPVVAEGVLEMADFGPTKRKCRITPHTGTPIMCTFEKSLDNDIYDLLRKPVTISGKAKLRATSDQIEVVHIHSISERRQHEGARADDGVDSKAPALSAVGSGDFFLNHTIKSLAQQQKIKPMNDLSVLAGGIPDEVDLDDFLGDIYASR